MGLKVIYGVDNANNGFRKLWPKRITDTSLVVILCLQLGITSLLSVLF